MRFDNPQPKKEIYTKKSLEMLESEEGQLNAVFACYGSAAQHGQFFEEALSDLLLAYNRLVKNPLSLDDLRSVESKLHKMTMGALLKELQKHVEIEAAWVSDLLNIALNNRNFLIHKYFLKRQAQFRTEAGRVEMLRELLSIQDALEKATSMTNGMRIALGRALGDNQSDSGSSQAVFSIKVDVPQDE